MPVSLRLDASYLGHRMVVLENELVEVQLFPDLGGRIYSLVYKPDSYQLLWRNPGLPLKSVELGASYDDNFCGGWEELFPNDAPTTLAGVDLPDHGEIWTRSWEVFPVRVTSDEVTLFLRQRGKVTGALLERWLTLRSGDSILRFRHRITNNSDRPLDFLWKLHPAMRSSEHHRVDVPGRRAEFVGPEWSRLPDAEHEFDWPLARNSRGETADMRFALSPSSGKKDFVYVKELTDGWCAITDTRSLVGFGLVFPREIFRWVWLFMPAGGWQGLNMVILEPCTAYPKDIHLAARNGNCARLEAGEQLECETLGVVYAGGTGVRSIASDGAVTFLQP